MGKLAARVERIRWQAQEATQLITSVFTTRIVLLVLAALVLWGSGGYVRDNACRFSGAGGKQQQQASLELPGFSYAADGRPGQQYGDVPGFVPPYILPKHIHQTVEDKTTMSCQVRESIQTWIDMNPGYTHTLYDAKDRVEFVKQHYPQLLDLFLALPTNVERADTWRYLALHKLGGVYADSDVKCMQPISTWNAEHGHDAALMVGIAKRSWNGMTQEFNQFVMASMPGHPVMAAMPLVISSNFAATFLKGQQVADQQGIRHDVGVLSRTGPGAFTAALRMYAQRIGSHWPINSTKADELGGIRFGTVRAMPKFVLGMGWDTIDHNMTCLEVKQKIRPEAYICHQFFGTWKKQPEVSVKLTYDNCPGNLRYNMYNSSSSRGGSSDSDISQASTSSRATSGSSSSGSSRGTSSSSSSSGQQR